MHQKPKRKKSSRSRCNQPIQWPILDESLKLHATSGNAYFLLPCGPGEPKRRFYQGRFFGPDGVTPLPKTLERAAHWLAAYKRAGGPPVDSDDEGRLTVSQVFDRVLEALERRGESRSELIHYTLALGAVSATVFGQSPAEKFGRAELRAVAEVMAESGRWGRRTLNSYLQRIRRAMGEAAHQGLIGMGVADALLSSKGINITTREAKNRFKLPEQRTVKPVAGPVIEATCEGLSPVLAVLVRVLRLTGARCGELVQLAPGLIDRNPELPPGASKGVWTFSPPEHKTATLGKARTIYLGPESQTLLAPLLIQVKGQDDSVFATPTGKQYSRASVTQAIKRAAERAGVGRWTAHQLRHTAATEIRRKYGIEAARVLLGHSDVGTTQIYAERDSAAAFKIASEVG